MPCWRQLVLSSLAITCRSVAKFEAAALRLGLCSRALLPARSSWLRASSLGARGSGAAPQRWGTCCCTSWRSSCPVRAAGSPGLAQNFRGYCLSWGGTELHGFSFFMKH